MALVYDIVATRATCTKPHRHVQYPTGGWHGMHARYEPKCCTAYPTNLHWRMVCQREALNLSYETIGLNLGVDPSTGYRSVNLFLKTGNVDKKQYNTANLPCLEN